MSWEEIDRNDVACPCGSGTFTIVSLSDDWNRTDQRWTMNCPSCKTRYTLVTFYGRYKGTVADIRFAWASADACKAADKLKERARKLLADAKRVAMAKFPDWSKKIDRRNKRSVWKALTNG